MRKKAQAWSVNPASQPTSRDAELTGSEIHVTGDFLGLAEKYCDPATARYAILPVPYEGTASYKKGTANGPQAIIDASRYVEFFDQELSREFHHAGVVTYPPVQVAGNPDRQMKYIRSAAEPISRSGKFLLSLGGEHSITVPLVQIADEVYGPISVLQIDAHADLRDTYQGTKYSHACVMRRVLEITEKICQVGIRSFSSGEFSQCPTQVDNFITPEMVRSEDGWISKVLDLLTERVYITIDMDGLDPSIAPGVGTPEPDGLNWRQVTSLLSYVCTERKVVAADVVELRPIFDNHITEFLAAKLCCKLIGYTRSC